MDNNNLTPPPTKPSRSLWTLSYRLQGLTICLALAAAFCYFYLGAWNKYLLIGAAVVGYLIGWLIGGFTYRKK